MDFLWWIIVPTLIILFLFAIYLLWREIHYQYFISSRKANSKDVAMGDKNLSGKGVPKVKPRWIEVMERSTGRMYYVNTTSGKVQWNRPSSAYVRYSGFDPILNDDNAHSRMQNKKIK